MRRIVLTFGLIAGAILSTMMALAMAFHDQIGFDRGMTVGYTSMVLSFLLVYFGVRSYRDTVGGGTVSFGRAFAVGILITVVATACYMVTWEFIYRFYLPDYLEKYALHALEKARQAGATAEQIAAQAREMRTMAEQYRNPLVRAAFTFLETSPVALVMSLVSAAMLRRREPVHDTGVTVGATSPAL